LPPPAAVCPISVIKPRHICIFTPHRIAAVAPITLE
jgi:hypothetical protein